jgi:CRISPR/Cas system-associated exonuclease Cas4 (RecB family)
MTEEQSPFDRPAVSQGYPLDRQEREQLEQVLHRVQEAAEPSPPPAPPQKSD